MFRRLFAGLILLMLAAPAAAAPVGFQYLTLPNGTEVGVWYPSLGVPVVQSLGLDRQTVVLAGPLAAGRHPLVVMSHGSGGSFDGHRDTAQALAAAGFVVAALTHPGDNWRDQSRATMVEERPRALSDLIDYLLTTWSLRGGIDPQRIGAFGFSSGGFTVLTAAGGGPDLSRIAEHCRTQRFYDCQVLAANPRPPAQEPAKWARDARIKALVVAAPALGFTFGREGLKGITVPVQLWRADDDRVLPPAIYADAVRDALPRRPEFHAVAGAGHFDFLAPCSPALANRAAAICTSAPGFDRAVFHARFNADVVRFFSEKLMRH